MFLTSEAQPRVFDVLRRTVADKYVIIFSDKVDDVAVKRAAAFGK